MKYVMAYDLGTGGLKTSLFDEQGFSVVSDFKQIETYYLAPEFREQKPMDWWKAVVSSTKDLLAKTNVNVSDIVAAAVSGHSLGVVPIARDGSLASEYVPIWTDGRAPRQAKDIFREVNEEEWYMKTGNGFPAHLYSAFKIRWYKENKPELYSKVQTFIGTKDYLNYRLTGVLSTDYSYASGSGVYDLIKCDYDQDYIRRFGLRPEDFPPLRESKDIIGKIKPGAAKELGLPEHLLIAAGGVDNACMAAGAGCVEDGMAYTSLGTSAWIAVSSRKPVLNFRTKPFVFGHLIKGMYVSAEPTFSAGNTFRWVRDVICSDLLEAGEKTGEDAYKLMDELAEKSGIGAKGLIFNPTMAGACSLDKSVNAKGAIIGLDLQHTRSDIVRAALEGVCLALRMALEELNKITALSGEMLIVGGGGKSQYWRQLFADIYGMDITESAVGEIAGSLGAAACAAIGAGLWKDYSPLVVLNRAINTKKYNRENHERYNRIFKVYRKVSDQQSEIADYKEEVFK
jgi:xylulokinase